jgi:hypothetical protein
MNDAERRASEVVELVRVVKTRERIGDDAQVGRGGPHLPRMSRFERLPSVLHQ